MLLPDVCSFRECFIQLGGRGLLPFHGLLPAWSGVRVRQAVWSFTAPQSGQAGAQLLLHSSGAANSRPTDQPDYARSMARRLLVC